jgi:ABC-type multidrug transport system fused ATPase/permease subunit
LKDWAVLHLPYRELPVEEPGTPDQRSPMRYLVWLAGKQKGLLTLNALFGIGWMVSQALLWAAVGAAIDQGVVDHDQAELLRWVGVVLALGLFQALCGALRHQVAVTNWMSATCRTIQVIGRHISTTGAALTDEIPASDVVNTVAGDAMRIGGAFDVFARFMGAIISWLVASVILLTTSVELGLIVLLGVPILAPLTTPLMRPLHTTQAQRLALARLVMTDPHTLVLDEATALLDPRAARHLERSLSAILEGRTVIAIAHRLHTAHDADRVCVVIDGRIAALGTHDELVATGGEYASLWASWRSEGPQAS